jgi:3-phenylpropionate/trans-cinnamate dioxygenase ferredoxin reductase subunit
MKHFDIAIVGTGHAGAQAAIALRQRGFTGSIALIGEEPDLPYQRPPLSKEYLSNEREFDHLLIRPTSFWAANKITLLLSMKVVRIDPQSRHLETAKGETVGYRKLVWATGGAPRRLSCEGHDLPGVHTIRARRDVDRLKVELDVVTRIVVIGGGFIGLEAAAAFSGLGKEVTLVEAEDRVLARVAGEPLSRFYEDEHRARGVAIRLDQTVVCLEGDARVTGVHLATGEVLPADCVTVGIGIVPAVAPLTDAGAAGANGVAVDDFCRTSLFDVYAIGDCAEHSSRFSNGERVRLESVQNAGDMANCVAKSLVGDPTPYDAAPWFWSNQFDLKLQTIGLSKGHDYCVTRGDPAGRAFSLIYLRQNRVVALDCVNSTADYVQGRAMVLAAAKISPDRLADTSVPLKSMLGE